MHQAKPRRSGRGISSKESEGIQAEARGGEIGGKEGERSIWRQVSIKSLPWSFQVAKSVIRIVRVCDPFFERVPPLILRAMTEGLKLLSAPLLSEGTLGSATKTKSSGRKFSIRFDKVWGGAEGSERYGLARSLNSASNAL